MPKGRAQNTNQLGFVTDRRGNGPPTVRARSPYKAPGSKPSPKGGPGSNLPLALTSFVGREREATEVEGLLSGTRLLTLTGPGGCGKTRLALRVAAALEDRGEPTDGTWWVGLSSLSDPNLVPNAVASALGVSDAPDQAPTEALATFLGAKEPMIVLDNCEHLVGACAALVDALLRSCPGLRILATSRELLGISGEVSWPVPPLSLPEPGQERNAGYLLGFGAVRLFTERARAASPAFVLTEENAPAVADLCARLDGMPLAIELAAARTRMLTPAQILARLDDRFRLLTGGRTAAPRHRTLRATTDWSHDLLSEEEKIFFRRLSVFAGGFTLEATETICAGDGIGSDEVLELLSCLVDRSLVVVSHSEAGADDRKRYRLLQTIRQYASEKLDESGEVQAVRRRHADFFLSLAEQAEPAMTGPQQAVWLERLEAEHDNLRAALGWLAEVREAERGLRLVAALLRFWWFRGHLTEGRAHLEALLGLPGAPPVGDEVRGKALHALAVLIYRQAGYVEGDWAVARSRLEESLEIYRRLGDELRVAAVLQDLGRVVAELGDWEAARTFLDESLEIGRRSGDEPVIALSLFQLGLACLIGADLLPARSYLEESLRIFRNIDDKFWINACLVYLGYIACEAGEHDAARSRFVEMNVTLPQAQFRWGATYVLEGFARLAAAEGQAVRALRLAGATAALSRTFGLSSGPSRQAAFRRVMEQAWSALGEEEGHAAFEEGRAMTLEQALAFALEEPEVKPDSPTEGILTAREAEVLSLVAEGFSDARAAERLYVSPRTVSQHLRRVYRKLGVSSRTAAIKRAGELGLI